MAEHTSALARQTVEYRKLWPTELPMFREHLHRLDPLARRMRFGHAVGEEFIDNYCDTIYGLNTLVYGCFVDGDLRGVAELRLLNDAWPFEAELAFSVENPWQDEGVGTELMGRILRAARNRGIGKLYMICLPENGRMQRVAKKYDAQLKYMQGQIDARVEPAHPDCFSLMHELLDDTSGFMTYILDLRH